MYLCIFRTFLLTEHRFLFQYMSPEKALLKWVKLPKAKGSVK